MQEIWKDVSGYEGSYQVSNKWAVKSLTRGVRTKGNGVRIVHGQVLCATLSMAGYPTVRLSLYGVYDFRTVHSLVLLCFVGERPTESTVINHLDFDKTNNNLENLEYCTIKDNTAHALANNLIKTGSDSWASKLTKEDREKIYERYLQGETCEAIAKDFNIHKSTVWRIKSGRYLRKFTY